MCAPAVAGVSPPCIHWLIPCAALHIKNNLIYGKGFAAANKKNPFMGSNNNEAKIQGKQELEKQVASVNGSVADKAPVQSALENETVLTPDTSPSNPQSVGAEGKKAFRPNITWTVACAIIMVASLAYLFCGLKGNTLTGERTGVFILIIFLSGTLIASRFVPKELIESMTKTFDAIKSIVLIFVFSLLMFEEGKDFFRRAIFKELPVNITLKISESQQDSVGEVNTVRLNDYTLILLWEGKNDSARDTLRHIQGDTSFVMNLGTGVTGVNFLVIKDSCKFLQGDIFKTAIIDANRNLPIIAQVVCD